MRQTNEQFYNEVLRRASRARRRRKKRALAALLLLPATVLAVVLPRLDLRREKAAQEPDSSQTEDLNEAPAVVSPTSAEAEASVNVRSASVAARVTVGDGDPLLPADAARLLTLLEEQRLIDLGSAKLMQSGETAMRALPPEAVSFTVFRNGEKENWILYGGQLYSPELQQLRLPSDDALREITALLSGRGE